MERKLTRRSRDASLHATGYMSATSADMQASLIQLPSVQPTSAHPGDPEGAPAVACGGPTPRDVEIYPKKCDFGRKMPHFRAGENGGKFLNFFLNFGTEGRPGFWGVKNLFPDGSDFSCGGKGGEGVAILRLYKSAFFPHIAHTRKSGEKVHFCDTKSQQCNLCATCTEHDANMLQTQE